MKIDTKRFGELEINNEDIITFPEGILGFDNINRFIVLGFEEQAPFKWLQSIDDAEVAFVIVEPFLFFPDYEFEISDEDKKLLEINNLEDILVYIILVIREKASESTANLMAPLILNQTKRKAKQIIIQTQKYTTKHKLLA